MDFNEKMIWFVLVPFVIATLGGALAMVIAGRFGTPNPLNQEMRHLSKIDKLKATIAAFESIDRDPSIYIFIVLRSFLKYVAIDFLMVGVFLLGFGLYCMFADVETKVEVVSPGLFIEITGGIFALMGILALGLGFLGWLHFSMLRRALRFSEHEKPKLEKRIRDLERVKKS